MMIDWPDSNAKLNAVVVIGGSVQRFLEYVHMDNITCLPTLRTYDPKMTSLTGSNTRSLRQPWRKMENGDK